MLKTTAYVLLGIFVAAIAFIALVSFLGTVGLVTGKVEFSHWWLAPLCLLCCILTLLTAPRVMDHFMDTKQGKGEVWILIGIALLGLGFAIGVHLLYDKFVNGYELDSIGLRGQTFLFRVMLIVGGILLTIGLLVRARHADDEQQLPTPKPKPKKNKLR